MYMNCAIYVYGAIHTVFCGQRLGSKRCCRCDWRACVCVCVFPALLNSCDRLEDLKLSCWCSSLGVCSKQPGIKTNNALQVSTREPEALLFDYLFIYLFNIFHAAALLFAALHTCTHAPISRIRASRAGMDSLNEFRRAPTSQTDAPQHPPPSTAPSRWIGASYDRDRVAHLLRIVSKTAINSSSCRFTEKQQQQQQQQNPTTTATTAIYRRRVRLAGKTHRINT